VNYLYGKEATAKYFGTVEDAFNEGLAMAERELQKDAVSPTPS
jgi:hypothetical protein